MLRPHRDADTIGQVRYALLVMIRPPDDPVARRKVEEKYMGVLFDERDKQAVLDRYALLKSRNIKHFPNPLKGDLNLTALRSLSSLAAVSVLLYGFIWEIE